MTKRIFILTGEPSGDLLGARLMQAIKRKLGDDVTFEGVGGTRMVAEGLHEIFPQRDLALFGLFELLPKIFLILKRLKQTVEHVKATQPDIVITIDSPDFSLRVGKRLKMDSVSKNIKLIHYVAPSVWAWRPERAKKIAAFLDHLLALFPFEPPYFTKEGLPCSFVGHTLVESGIDRADGNAFRARHEFRDSDVLLTVLPGSRGSEVSRLLDVFEATAEKLHDQIPNLKVIVPTVPHVAQRVRDHVTGWTVPVLVVEDEGDKYAAFRASQAALCASGTVTLELALANLPMVVAYKLSALTVALYRHMFTIKHFSLVNILLGREVVPERLQQFCNPEQLTADLLPLLRGHAAADAQRMELQNIAPMLQNSTQAPSDAAADVVVSYL